MKKNILIIHFILISSLFIQIKSFAKDIPEWKKHEVDQRIALINKNIREKGYSWTACFLRYIFRSSQNGITCKNTSNDAFEIILI